MSVGGDPDAALIDASRNGDCAAFAQIVERYQRAVYAVSFSSVRDHALSDDITQDTFVTAWRQLGDLRDTARLPAWLCGIARNHARDARKRKRHEPANETCDKYEPADPTTPFDALSDAESERLLAIALADIPDVYREPLVLFYYEHQSVEDVARVLGITAHTTNKRLSRGRQHLAARIEALVERKLGSRGPKRDLAASVAAAIAVLGPAGRADAATATSKGFTMPKLALATILLATVGGAGALLADTPTTKARSSAAPPPAKAAPAAPATPAGSTARRPAAPTAAAPAPATPTTAAATRTTAAPAVRAPSAPSLPPPAAPSVAPSCDTVGRHMAALQLSGLDKAKRMPAPKLEQFIALRGRDLARRCTAQRWPEDRRTCVMGADDYDSARVDCVEGIVATPEELVAIPPELTCDVVAKHIVKLMTAPDGKLGIISKKPGGDKLDVAQMAEQVREQQAAECERIPWSIAVRRCIVTSKTNQQMADCT